MCTATDLHLKIGAHHVCARAHPHHRYRSWEHCYRFFQSKTREALAAEKDVAALHLGFYLASWGMYRGSSFLLQHSYTVHEGVVEKLASTRFSDLWGTEIGSQESDVQLVPLILDAVNTIKEAYKPFGVATDTLATKVVLGTLGCLPACDRFFVNGFKKSGRQYSYVNRMFVRRILHFCTTCKTELRCEQTRIKDRDDISYPLMKLVDMYFWQCGYESKSGAR